jgi:hypothetical protein
MVELKPVEPKSVQKTVRVPTPIMRWLEVKAKRVKPEISVPNAIVQILQDEFERDSKATGT